MNHRVTWHFVTVGNRRVNHSRTGSASDLALLHALPGSGKGMRLPQQIFAAHFTAIALDNPGFGLPGSTQSIEALTPDALADLDRLGVGRFTAWGDNDDAAITIDTACLAEHA